MIGGMLSWSQKRKLAIIGGVLLALILFLVLPSLFILRNKPACTNGVKDAGEKGVDCGGACRFLCEGDALAPLINFARAVEVAPNVWGAVASLENRNADAGALRAPYALKLYDESNLLVAERHGEAYIPPKKVFAVFESGMKVGDRQPTRATFEFTGPIRFSRMTPEPVLEITGKHIEQEGTTARLIVVLHNPNLFLVGRIGLQALLYGDDGNVFAASATEVEGLSPGQSSNRSFTWSRALPDPARVEVLYTVPGKP